jgi:hypothetical protein
VLAALLMAARADWNGGAGRISPSWSCDDPGRDDGRRYQVCDSRPHPHQYNPTLYRFLVECPDPTPDCRERLNRLRRTLYLPRTDLE